MAGGNHFRASLYSGLSSQDDTTHGLLSVASSQRAHKVPRASLSPGPGSPPDRHSQRWRHPCGATPSPKFALLLAGSRGGRLGCEYTPPFGMLPSPLQEIGVGPCQLHPLPKASPWRKRKCLRPACSPAVTAMRRLIRLQIP